MELWIFAAVAGMVAVAAFVWFASKTTRSAEATVAADELYGPLPEREVERAEVTDPAGSGQVTPGAVTPAAAGSPEAYYEATGVGSGGPKHLSGPPPAVGSPTGRRDQDETHTGRSSASGPTVSAWRHDADEERGFSPLPFVGIAGAGVGLAIYLAIKRRFRRRSRMERLKARAQRLTAVAGAAASGVSQQAGALAEHVDRRSSAGGGAGLALALAIWMLVRSRRDDEAPERRDEEEEAAVQRWLAADRARAWLAAMGERTEARAATGRACGWLPRWPLALAIAGAVAALIATRRRSHSAGVDWTGLNVPDSAPGRDRAG